MTESADRGVHSFDIVKKIWIGIDTGGTFTDLVLCELTSGRYTYHKLPTSTGDPAQAVLDGIAEVIALAQLPRSEVEFLVLGTTLGTNAVLEGKCARTGMITTAGFRDVIELARQRRPHYFNLDILKPTPPAARDCRIEVTERIAHDGAEVTPLVEDDVRNAVADAARQAGGGDRDLHAAFLREPRARAARARHRASSSGPRSICARRPTCCRNSASSSALRRRR